jgi:hypothetical protein
VALTSSVATSSRNASETVFDSDLGAITVPALVVANSNDTCPSSSPSLAPKILAALTGAPRKELIVVGSDAIQGDPCGGLSPHGYLGIEGDVVQRISAWIGRLPRRLTCGRLPLYSAPFAPGGVHSSVGRAADS